MERGVKLLGTHTINPPHEQDARPWARDPLTGEIVYVVRSRPRPHLDFEWWRELERRAWGKSARRWGV